MASKIRVRGNLVSQMTCWGPFLKGSNHSAWTSLPSTTMTQKPHFSSCGETVSEGRLPTVGHQAEINTDSLTQCHGKPKLRVWSEKPEQPGHEQGRRGQRHKGRRETVKWKEPVFQPRRGEAGRLTPKALQRVSKSHVLNIHLKESRLQNQASATLARQMGPKEQKGHADSGWRHRRQRLSHRRKARSRGKNGKCAQRKGWPDTVYN